MVVPNPIHSESHLRISQRLGLRVLDPCPEKESMEAMLTTSKDWKAVSNDSSVAFTYGIEDGQLTKMSSSPSMIGERVFTLGRSS